MQICQILPCESRQNGEEKGCSTKAQRFEPVTVHQGCCSGNSPGGIFLLSKKTLHGANAWMSVVPLLVGREVSDGSYVQNASPCSMCARLIINAGISTVVVRDTRDA